MSDENEQAFIAPEEQLASEEPEQAVVAVEAGQSEQPAFAEDAVAAVADPTSNEGTIDNAEAVASSYNDQVVQEGSEVTATGGETAVQSISDSNPDDRKIFVGGLSWNTTKEQMQEYFEQFGPVADCTVKQDGGYSRGFGFVTFLNTEGYSKALAKEEHTLDGRKIDPKKAEPREPKQDDHKRKVFLGGLDPELTEEQVREYFEKFGEIETLELPKDRTSGQRKSFGFVTYKTEEEAKKACEESKQMVGSRECEVKIAVPHQKAQFQRGGYANRSRGAPYGGYPSYGGYGGYAQSYGYGYGYDQYGGWGDYRQAYGYPYGGYDYWGYEQQASNYGKASRGNRGNYHPYQR